MCQRRFLFLLGGLLILVWGWCSGSFAQEMNLGVLSYSLVSGSYTTIDQQGNYAFASTGYGFKIFNVTDPADPQEIAHVPTEGLCIGVTAVGEVLYVCDYGSGLLSYDISDINAPEFLDALPIEGHIRSAYPNGDYLYVCAEEYGVQIVEASNPADLQLVNTVFTGGETYQVVILGDWMYVTLGVAGLGVYDISDPVNPVFTLIWNTTGGKTLGSYIFPSGDLLAVADYTNGVHLLSLAPFPWIPTWTATATMPPYAATTVTGGYGYGVGAFSSQGIQSFSLTGTQLDYFEVGENLNSVFSVDNYLYALEAEIGLKIINCDSPLNLYQESELLNYGQTWAVRVYNDVAYVANMLAGLTVLDVTDVENPVYIESNPTGYWAKDVFISPDGEYCYVADFSTGVNVFSLADPLHPQLLNVVPTVPDSGAHAFEYRDGYLYLAVHSSGLNVFDLADPENPDLVFASQDSILFFREIAISEDGQNLYACAPLTGVLVYSIISPDSIVHELTLNFDNAYDIAINGDYAYVADWDNGLYALDITNFAYVFKVDSLPPQDGFSGVSVIDENHLAAADWTAGLALVDISDPYNLSEIDRIQTPGYAQNASTPDGQQLFLADTYDLLILDLYSTGIKDGGQEAFLPDQAALLNLAYPNPFNSSTRLSFALRAPGQVKLTIYDAAGREVAVPVNAHCSQGTHEIQFTPDDLASGIYFAHLDAGGTEQVQKLLFLK